MNNGVLNGLTVVEFAGIGPAPFACMMLADMGARVIRIERLTAGALSHSGGAADILSRGRELISLDLKHPDAVAVALKLIASADILVEGFRPGVMEKLGLGPDVCFNHKANLIYGRMTGWGQTGPLKQAAGHDLNYIAISGALHAIGTKTSGPVVPLNVVGDFGGGSMYLLVGVLAALHEAKQSGKGQVVDAAICDGAISLMSATYGFLATGMWEDKRYSNMLDGAAPYYDVYECADAKWVSIAAIEPQFYRLLAELLEEDLGDADLMKRFDKSTWPERKIQIATIIKTKTQADWCRLMEGTDVCFAPVLSMQEAIEHPHNKARQNFIKTDNVHQPAPAPRFERTPSTAGGVASACGDAILADIGYQSDEIKKLKASGLVQ